MIFLFKRLCATLLVLAALWLVGFVWFITLIPKSPTADNETTDAIVVLTGGSLRLEHGLALLIANKAPLLFVSGVDETITLPSLLHGKEVTALTAQVPPERIELGHTARSTLQNAEETKYWASKHHIQSIRLVTGNYHTPRSVFLMHQALPGVLIIADPVFPAEFSDNSWWLSKQSLKLVLSEYHKYIASRLAVMLGIISDE